MDKLIEKNKAKQNNKIVIFDWGGVIESHYDGEYNIYEAVKNVMKHFNVLIGTEELKYRLSSCDEDESDRNISTYSTIKDVRKWFERIKNEIQLKCSFEDYCKVYDDEGTRVDYYKDVVLLAHDVKKYCKIGILSNLMYIDEKRIDSQVNLKKFDYVWLSYKLGYRKPDEKIYDLVEKDCNICPNNILFIDDTEENLIIAKQRGWNICQANGHEIEKIKQSIFKFIEQ